MAFSGFDPEAFLRDYWQQKSLLIRKAWDPWVDPITPEELAGLACEETVESRLIVGGNGGGLEVEHGPVSATRFDALGTADWTLLVQAVDHHSPEVAALLESFRFIPNWRIDDVMVSFAAKNGGVGAHFDQYDVFLIQGLGQRKWQIGAMCDEASELLPNGDLRLLKDFTPEAEWLLEPGDMLYVPPGIAHNGVAASDHCMTYSVGFRAPSRGDLIGGWMDDLLKELGEEDRYGDAALDPQSNPGEISAKAIGRLHAMVTEKLADRDAFSRWFGAYNSTAKHPEIDWRPGKPMTVEELTEANADGVTLIRNPAARFAYIERASGAVMLFTDGEAFDCTGASAEFARAICAWPEMQLSAQILGSAATLQLVVDLINRGVLAIES
ncbi:cupin domain-containing protein [Pontixanthobacter aquaemixtae]|uniref:Cupin domain-containing protein n=1 Tax=Pontixanthobacter aquaemixtae TaxID=1958940 RepID=A0A844ZT27_9SPHN|nr:cupin domain-containing protein [Pontixanthobacter aquaemixtae]MXO91471.1 cupin domain-containing protein [Pontixanthobacter aquaemixtae]